jgi:hypothetical protein
MSIAPIDYSAFQRSPVGIEAVLARGGSALSSILRDAMQVGRDRANRQASQEKDFIEEQRRDINLNNRRSEFAEGTRRYEKTFDEGVRRFDTGFDEGVRQFNVGFEEDARQFNIQSERDTEKLGFERDAAQRASKTFQSQVEEAKFRRENILPKELEIKTKELEAETARIAGIKDESERRKAEADLKVGREKQLTETLTAIDTLAKQGDPQSLAAAQSLYTGIIENPTYEVDEGTRERLSQRLNLPTDRGTSFSRSSSVGGGAEVDPREEMTLEQLDEAIRIEEEAIKATSTQAGSVKDNRNLLQLKEIRARKQAAKNGASDEDIYTMADFLRRGAESRGAR